MASVIEIDTPHPGDTVGPTISVSGVWSTDLAVAVGDKVQVILKDKDDGPVGLPKEQPIAAVTGSWLVSFSPIDAGDDYKLTAKLLIAAAGGDGVADTDDVVSIDVSVPAQGTIVVRVGPIP